MSCALSYKSSKYTSTLTAISNITNWSSIGYNRNIITFLGLCILWGNFIGKIFNNLSVIRCYIDLPKYLQINRVVLEEGWHIQLKQFYFCFLNLLVSLTDYLLSSITIGDNTQLVQMTYCLVFWEKKKSPITSKPSLQKQTQLLPTYCEVTTFFFKCCRQHQGTCLRQTEHFLVEKKPKF